MEKDISVLKYDYYEILTHLLCEEMAATYRWLRRNVQYGEFGVSECSMVDKPLITFNATDL